MDVKKIAAKLPPGYAEDTASMDAAQLRAEIVKAETAALEVRRERDADEKLSGAKEIARELAAPYRDAEKAQRAKVEWVLHLLEERGQLGVGGAT